jgi:membrane protease subunit (stomatin/prohibitin family)
MPGLLRGMARTAVVVGTASAVAGGVQHRQQQRYAAQDQQQAEAAAPEAQATVPDDTYAELEKLGQLKAEGILTQDEFDAKKKQILGL